MIKIHGFLPRNAAQKADEWLKQDYIVALLGARQTGKTTLMQKMAEGKKSFYYTLDDLLIRNKVASDFYFLQKDLEARLGTTLEKLDHQIYLLIDEAQKEPSVFDYLKILSDNYRSKIKIIVSGSASLEIQKKSSESLAARAQYVYLHPLSIGEIIKENYQLKNPKSLFNNLFSGQINQDFLLKNQSLLYPVSRELDPLLKDILLYGLLPGTWSRSPEERLGYFRSIVNLYLEKDIRIPGLVKKIENFQIFIEIISYNIGQILNLTSLSTQIQISTNTLRSFRSLLKNTFVLNSIFPYIDIPQKRIVKNPKVYFYDVGVANYLSGREKFENVLDSKSSGGIFENIIIKSFESFSQNETLPIKTYFYRNYQGKEIDLILKKEGKITPIEITNSQSIDKKKIKNLSSFLNEEKNSEFGLIIYTGTVKEMKTKNKKIFALPWWLWW